jgi:hypothetical protein
LRSHADLLDSFFPLGNWRQPGAATWDGFARLSRDSDGLVALFKNQSGTSSVEIQLVAPPSARYDVQSMITGESKGQVTAEELGKGWKVDLPGGHSAEVLALRRITGQ